MTTYRFDQFELDLDALQLRREGAPIRLERRPLDLLVLLAGRHGRLVTREECVAALWPERVIIDFDSGLNTLVRKVRHALGDSSDQPRFVETVPGRGYRFIAPVTEAGIADGPAANAAASPQRARPRPALVAAAIIVFAVAAVFLWRYSAGPDETRLVVLPFENLTGDDAQAYLASGLAEDVSLSLASVDLENLRIIGGVSARAMAESALTVREIGRELDADFVVQSSLRSDQGRLRVTTRLIRVADSEQVWTASFDRELTNVLGLQRELSVAIAEQIRQRLSPEVAAAIDRRQTQNPEAYRLYLRGRHEWSRLQPNSVPRALENYRRATEIDPGYALAWAGIAHALVLSPVTAAAERNAVVDDAREALEHGLRNGAELSEVQFALGASRFFIDWDLAGAEQAARAAVAADPNSAMAHMFLGIVLSQSDQDVEAQAMLRRARELDPLFPLTFANSGVVAMQAGDTAAAVDYFRQAIAINPEFWVAHFHLGNALLALGNDEEALAAFDRARRYSGELPYAVARAGHALALLGREEEARAVLRDLEGRARSGYVPPSAFAVVYAGLQEPEHAFEWLERALAERDVGLLALKHEHFYVNLRSDPRFDSLLERMGMAPDPRG